MRSETRGAAAAGLGGWKRDCWAGELRAADAGREVTLMGWVSRRREHGGVSFIDLRDRSGLVQVVLSGELAAWGAGLSPESVVAVRGRVALRPEGMANPELPTGEVEVAASDLRLLNRAKTPPIYTRDLAPRQHGAGGEKGSASAGERDAEGETGEAMRLRYRYLDLRRPRMQANLALRHRMVKAVRDYLDARGFWEVETPFLTRSTPEGARDYLVPARNAPGKFYALPQSPQIFKQLLMVAGVERYFQVVRCFRDEDLRADRQPEFTQIDIEMSFVEPADVVRLTEGLMAHIWREVLGVDLQTPFPRLDFAEAVASYGTDKPDLRFGMRIADLTAALEGCGFRVFGEAARRGEVVRGLAVPGGAAVFSRKDLDLLTREVQKFGAKGLVWAAFEPSGVRSPVSKFLTGEEVDTLRRLVGAGEGDLGLYVAAPPDTAAAALGHLRLHAAERLGLRDTAEWCFVWVVNYPLFEPDEETGGLGAKHHPFTAPFEEDLGLLETAPLKVRAKAYDLVLNGWELGGGSVRNHSREVQERVFEALGLAREEYLEKFGFLLEALEYGAPPHGGIALGVDRIAALLAGEESIREVIAFPKTTRAACLLSGAPSDVGTDQLAELGLRTRDRTFEPV